MIGLIFLHGGNGCGIPFTIWIATEVVLTDQGLLNLRHAIGIDRLLAAGAARLVAAVREPVGRAGVAGRGSARVCGERGRRKKSRGE